MQRATCNTCCELRSVICGAPSTCRQTMKRGQPRRNVRSAAGNNVKRIITRAHGAILTPFRVPRRLRSAESRRESSACKFSRRPPRFSRSAEQVARKRPARRPAQLPQSVETDLRARKPLLVPSLFKKHLLPGLATAEDQLATFQYAYVSSYRSSRIETPWLGNRFSLRVGLRSNAPTCVTSV